MRVSRRRQIHDPDPRRRTCPRDGDTRRLLLKVTLQRTQASDRGGAGAYHSAISELVRMAD